MKQKTKITISAILVVIWMAVIFCFSAVPADESNKQSLNIVNKAIEKFEAKSSFNDNTPNLNNVKNNIQNNTTTQQLQYISKNKNLILELNKVLRKFAHASVYFILYMLILNLIYQVKQEYKFTYCMISIMVCFLYACTDEFHQLFVDGRAGLFSDVLIDTLGATVSFIFVEIIYKIITLIHQKK